MHLKLTKHGSFCKHNNQLPTKSHDELKDNFIMRVESDQTIVCKEMLQNHNKWEELLMAKDILIEILIGREKNDVQ